MKNDPLKFSDLLVSLHADHKGEDYPLGETMEKLVEEATKAALLVGKPATVTMTITLEPTKRGEMLMTAQTASKEPKAKPTQTHFYTDMRGRLFSIDPKQQTFENITPIKKGETA